MPPRVGGVDRRRDQLRDAARERRLGSLSAFNKARARTRSPRSLSLPAINSPCGPAVPPTRRRKRHRISSSVNAGLRRQRPDASQRRFRGWRLDADRNARRESFNHVASLLLDAECLDRYRDGLGGAAAAACFSGEDRSTVDRSGAYAVPPGRKNVVAPASSRTAKCRRLCHRRRRPRRALRTQARFHAARRSVLVSDRYLGAVRSSRFRRTTGLSTSPALESGVRQNHLGGCVGARSPMPPLILDHEVLPRPWGETRRPDTQEHTPNGRRVVLGAAGVRYTDRWLWRCVAARKVRCRPPWARAGCGAGADRDRRRTSGRS